MPDQIRYDFVPILLLFTGRTLLRHESVINKYVAHPLFL